MTSLIELLNSLVIFPIIGLLLYRYFLEVDSLTSPKLSIGSERTIIKIIEITNPSIKPNNKPSALEGIASIIVIFKTFSITPVILITIAYITDNIENTIKNAISW